MKKPVQFVVLTGFMAAGKTTVARALAQYLDCQMADLDWLIEEREKREIASFIREEGEERFRWSETFSLRLVLERKVGCVIALGGGAWMLEQNRALIREHHGLTVWLDTPFELCWRRIAQEKELRPLALDRQSAHRLYRSRRPLYELADLHMHVTEERTAEELALEIENAMRRRRRFVKD
jgi:shikimate kinase